VIVVKVIQKVLEAATPTLLAPTRTLFPVLTLKLKTGRGRLAVHKK
jgi:hypothetical protein